MSHQMTKSRYALSVNITDTQITGVGVGNHIACAFDTHSEELDAFAWSPVKEGELIPAAEAYRIKVAKPDYKPWAVDAIIRDIIEPRVKSHILEIKAMFDLGADKVWVFREGHEPQLGPFSVYTSTSRLDGVKEAIEVAFLNAVCNDAFLFTKIKEGKLVIAWISATDVRRTLDLPSEKKDAHEVARNRFERIFSELESLDEHIVDAVLLKLAGIAFLNAAYKHGYALPGTPGHDTYTISTEDADGIVKSWNQNLINAADHLVKYPLETPYKRIREDSEQKEEPRKEQLCEKHACVEDLIEFLQDWIVLNKPRMSDRDFRKNLRKIDKRILRKYSVRNVS